MPNPLPALGPNVKLDDHRPWVPPCPEISNAVATIMAIWAEIDMHYGRLLAYFVKGNHLTIMAMYESLRSDEVKMDVLLAAARQSLSVEDYTLIQAIVLSCKTARRQRNIFAHHIYYSIVGRNDCVVMSDPINIVRYSTALEKRSHEIFGGERVKPPTEPTPEPDQSKMMVYTIADMQACVAQTKSAHFRIFRIAFAVDGHPSKCHTLPELLAEPQVQRLFDKLILENTSVQR